MEDMEKLHIVLNVPKEIGCSKEELKDYLYVLAQIEIDKALNTYPRSK